MAAANNSRSKRLSGDEEQDLDSRNRVNLSNFRAQLGETFVFALTEFGSLCAYPTPVWDKKFDELELYSPNSPGRATYMRMLFELCEEEIKFEAGGRVTIPIKLRERANIKGKVSIRASGERLEIWDPEEKAKYEESEDDYNSERQAKLFKAYQAMIASPKMV